MIKTKDTIKTHSNRSNVKRAIVAFRDKHPDMTETAMVLVPRDGERFSLIAILLVGATDQDAAACEAAGIEWARLSPQTPSEPDDLNDPSQPIEEPPAEVAPCPMEVDAPVITKAAKKAARDAARAAAKEEVKQAKAGAKAAKAAQKPAIEARKGDKTATVLRMLLSTNGVTMAEVTEATGWRTMTFPGFAAKQGLTLTKNDDRPARYFGAKTA